MAVKLELYRVFKEVAETGNISAAAKNLYISQSAVSQSIKQLETALQARLFARSPRGVTLTGEGQMLYQYVRNALGLLATGEDKLSQAQQLLLGTLTIGASDTVTGQFLTPYLDEFHHQHPGIRLKIVSGRSAKVVSMLRSGAVDIAFASSPKDSTLETWPCFTTHSVFVAGKNYHCDFDKIYTRQEMAEFPLILLERKASSRVFLEQEFLKAGVTLTPEIELSSRQLLVTLAGIGLGVAGVTLEFVRKDLESGDIRLLKTDFMISKGFTYCIPPFMIHGNVVEGVMSQTDMDAMMYKIEGEDLYLIGTSEHSMIGRFIDQIIPSDKLPQTLTSYSPCFRKEKGSHGIEERGVYRIHQFEKQEMIVVCKPEDSKAWYDKLWNFSVELFRSMDIPVRQLECCSGDLADLKVKSCDIEAWSPRQQKYFEVCSCSNLGDAQARRLRIRYKDENGKMQLCHTLNNTCVAPPRMLIAFLENNLQADGTVKIPEVLWPYMGGTKVLVPTKK